MCDKNAIPFDSEKPFMTSGVRLGTAAGTTRGFDESEFRRIGELALEVLSRSSSEGDAATEARVLEQVLGLCAEHPVYAPGSV